MKLRPQSRIVVGTQCSANSLNGSPLFFIVSADPKGAWPNNPHEFSAPPCNGSWGLWRSPLAAIKQINENKTRNKACFLPVQGARPLGADKTRGHILGFLHWVSQEALQGFLGWKESMSIFRCFKHHPKYWAPFYTCVFLWEMLQWDNQSGRQTWELKAFLSMRGIAFQNVGRRARARVLNSPHRMGISPDAWKPKRG